MSRLNHSDIKYPEELPNVYCLLGEALWMCQTLEEELCYFITMVLKLPPVISKKEIHRSLVENQRKTLGQLIKELKRVNPTNAVAEFEQRINKILGERNWLVHSSWRENHLDVYDPERLPYLKERLESISEEVTHFREIFGRILHQRFLTLGVDPKKAEAKKLELLKKWGAI